MTDLGAKEASGSIAGQGRIEIKDLEVVYTGIRSRTHAIVKTNVVFEAGSFNALVGPTGCGKSTLLNVIAGFVPATKGHAQIDNTLITDPGPDRAVLFQQYALMPWFTARGNVEFALKRFGMPKRERRAQAERALAEVGLEGVERSYPAELSGGMQQRVALARTLASRPKVLLMDEPFGALDAQTRLTMQELLLDLWDQDKITVVFVTHDVDEALVLSDRVFVMTPRPGRIERVLEVAIPRPRSVEDLDGEYLTLRKEVLHRLRH